MSEWKDITSYSKTDDGVPRSFELRAGDLRIVVTRRHGDHGWYLACEPFFNYDSMKSQEIDQAKQEAITRVTLQLRKALEAL